MGLRNFASSQETECILVRSRFRFKNLPLPLPPNPWLPPVYTSNHSLVQARSCGISLPSCLSLFLPYPSPRTVHLTFQVPHQPRCFLSLSAMVTWSLHRLTQESLWHLLTQFPLYTLALPLTSSRLTCLPIVPKHYILPWLIRFYKIRPHLLLQSSSPFTALPASA